MKQPIKWGLLSGVVLFALLFAFVLVSGSTFGQRCGAAGFAGAEYEACIERLRAGGVE